MSPLGMGRDVRSLQLFFQLCDVIGRLGQLSTKLPKVPYFLTRSKTPANKGISEDLLFCEITGDLNKLDLSREKYGKNLPNSRELCIFAPSNKNILGVFMLQK